MGCVHSCGDAIEESGEEIDNSNDGKRREKKRDNATTKKEPNKDKSSEKDNKSWYLDPKEEESSLKANNSKDVKQAKDTNSKASPFTVSFLNQSNDNEACPWEPHWYGSSTLPLPESTKKVLNQWLKDHPTQSNS
jgi:CRISPR/Cas system-associated protein Cas5 (RAMP superfamily)